MSEVDGESDSENDSYDDFDPQDSIYRHSTLQNNQDLISDNQSTSGIMKVKLIVVVKMSNRQSQNLNQKKILVVMIQNILKKMRIQITMMFKQNPLSRSKNF